ncbi:MAG TPA: hypothetical protein VGH19_16150 [Verrucomicrobiae bacterium]
MKNALITLGLAVVGFLALKKFLANKDNADPVKSNQLLYRDLSVLGMTASNVARANDVPLAQRGAGEWEGVNPESWWPTFADKPRKGAVFLPKGPGDYPYDQILPAVPVDRLSDYGITA